MDWKLWLKGLAAAAIGGGATGATQVVTTTGTVNKTTAIVSGVGALVSVLAYLIKSPLTSDAPPPVAYPGGNPGGPPATPIPPPAAPAGPAN